MQIPDIAILTTAMGALVILTNAITELFKAIFPKLPAHITATVIALVLTICAIFAYITINAIAIEWYMIVGSVVAGFFVSYTAQFGYDKFHEIVKLLSGGGGKE